MKSLSTIGAGMLLAFLALAPLISSVAAATVSVSVSPGAASGATAMSITGTVSPAPGAGVNAFIQVTNPAGKAVAAASVTVDATTGAFSYAFTTGGTSLWATGTYTVTATAAGATGTTTFMYTCTDAICGAGVSPGGATTAINVQVTAESPVWPGQTITISALTSSAANGSLIEAIFQTIHYHTPAGGLVTLCTNTVVTNCTGTFVRIHIGFYEWTLTLPSSSVDGGYFIHAWVNNGPSQQGQGLGQFTVNSALAQQGTLTEVSTAVAAIQNQVTTTFGGLSTTLSQLQLAATATQDAANKAAAAATTLSSSVNTIVNGVQSSQTYILVVAALAAITLVLELAILVRKLS